MERTLKFRYQMELVFSDYVKQHEFTLRMIPYTDERQQITECMVKINPECEVFEDTDTFGNGYMYGKIEEEHNRFGVDIEGIAKVKANAFAPVSNTDMKYCYQSCYTKPGYRLKEYHKKYKRKNNENDEEYATRIMHALKNDIEYKQGVTDINTTAEEAMNLKAGVCQDYSHIMLSLLRAEGIASRYVVGMMQGEGYSHAWVEVAISNFWRGFDPTNDKIVDDGYIKISSGRDYRDCIVNRGFFYGNVTQNQSIKVVVSEV
jgi:transglutaminase/protease-like cytokinesis protein 3